MKLRIVLTAMLLVPFAAIKADEERPNIVFIMADDLGYGALGCYGQTLIETPHIDKVAAQGMRFTQCYAGAHVCQPSRSVLMTGLHGGHTPVRANDTQQYLLPEHITVAEKLKSQGYATGGFGKWGLGYEGTTGHPNQQGFDEFFGQYLQVHAHFYYPFWLWHNDSKHELFGNRTGMNQYVADELHAAAKAFIRKHAHEPFFAYLPYIIPHVELVVPEDSTIPYRGKFPKVSIQDPRKNYLGSEDGLTTYAGMISRYDGHVGEIIQLLDELGLTEKTILFITSDNGAQNGGMDGGWTKMTDYFSSNAHLRGYKGTFYEGGIRVPFIVKWPNVTAAGSTSDHICGFWDVMPTLCEIAGVSPPAETDGISIVPTLRGEEQQRRHEGIYWEYAGRIGLGRAARMGDWKAVQSRPDRMIELYNLQEDPGETQDSAKEHPDKVAKLKAFMDAAHVDQPPFPGPAIKTSVLDYVDGPWLKP